MVAMAGVCALGVKLGWSIPLMAGGVGIIASALCIASIGCLSHQSTASTGTTLGVVGVASGVGATLLGMTGSLSTYAMGQIAGLSAVGYSMGALLANSIKITELPQMVRRLLQTSAVSVHMCRVPLKECHSLLGRVEGRTDCMH